MDKPRIMNPDIDLLIETLDIIAGYALDNPTFCGSDHGRRLRELRWQLTGQTQFKEPVRERRIAEHHVVVDRLVSLPVDVDNALTAAAKKSGASRDALIAGALETLLVQKRLV